MPLPAIIAGLEALLARAAAGFGARAIAGGASDAIGSRLFSAFVDGRVAKGAARVYRGVSQADLATEFAQPAAGVPGMKTYQTSRAAAEAAAGQGGQVLRIDLPKANLASYSPSPMQGGGTQYSVPFTEHFGNARQVVPNPFRQAASGWGSHVSGGNNFGGFPGSPVQLQPPSNVQNSPFPPSMHQHQQVGNNFTGFGGFSNSQSGSSGGGGSRFAGYQNAVRNWMANSTPGQLYHGLQNLASWRSTPPPQPARPMPFNGGGTSYPSISPSNLIGMAGQQPGQIMQANAQNASQQAYQQQLAQNMRALAAVTNQVKVSFTNLVFSVSKAVLLWGSGVGPYTLHKTVTAANDAYLDSRISEHEMYNADFSRMRIQRNLQDIQLSRDTASSTSGSANFLNEQNMEGRRLWSEIRRDLLPLMQAILGGVQLGANNLTKLAEYTTLLPVFRALGRWIEKQLGGRVHEMNIPHGLVDEARRQQRGDRKRKAPLRGID